MKFFVFLLFVGAALALWRIWSALRKLREKPDDWDAKLIKQLRMQGSDPFKPHEVDFFFGLPDEAAARSVVAALVAEGFESDLRHVAEQTDFSWSVHARKEMRLAVPEMQAQSAHFTALAERHQGRYDGWAAGHVERTDDGGVTLRKRVERGEGDDL